MHVTAIALAKPKGKYVMVLLESACSGHKRIGIRERIAEKLEVVRRDPYAETDSFYSEIKKIKTIRSKIVYTPSYGIPKFDENGEIVNETVTKKRKIPPVADKLQIQNP